MSEKNEWKPIESAPKDGTEILAWRSDCGQFIASYTSADAFPMTQDELDAWDEETLFAKDWFTQWPQALRLEGSEIPTHWMPLPAEPCLTCNGHGMVGGLTPHSGYDAEPCPDCTPAPSAPGDAQDERQAFEAWGLKGCEMVDDPRSMRMEIARHCAWEAWQARARIGAPAAGDALDKARLDWLEQHNGRNQPIQNAPMVDSYSINGEDFQEGEASDALQDLYDRCQLEIGTEYRLGVAEKPDPADFFDVSHLIEQMQERAYDEGGEFAEDYLADLTEEQVHELDRVVKAWLTSVSPSVTFFSVKGIQTFSVTQEDIDSFRGRAGTEAA